LLVPARGLGEEKNGGTAEKDGYKFFSLNGIALSADALGAVNYLIGGTLSSEASLEVNIGNRLYPIAEIGYGYCNTTDETSGIHYRTQAPYYRVGVNYNFFTKKEKPNPKNYIYGIARIGWCNFKYDVDTPPITDPVWGGTTDFELYGEKASCSWFELGVGVQVKVWKNFHMGWSVRYKTRLKDGDGENSKVWYIPGYGENKSCCFGGTCNLIIDIPFSKN
jgi:hypothetical protein